MRFPSSRALLLFAACIVPACTTPIVIRDAGRADTGSRADAGLDAAGLDATTDAPAIDGSADDAMSSDGGARACAGRTGLTCGPAEVCVYTIDDACGAFDATGICQAIPAMCTRDLAPVCGCDGVTYDNECEARRAGTSARTEEACASVCDEDDATCGEPPPSCVFGVSTASVVDGCWGPCVPIETCVCITRGDCPNEAERCDFATMRCEPR